MLERPREEHGAAELAVDNTRAETKKPPLARGLWLRNVFDYAVRSGTGATGAVTSVDGPEPGAMVIDSPGPSFG